MQENNTYTATDVIIIGGGPGGCIAALSLRKLGREVTLLEKSNFPRYQIGESLLPGTLSILSRLGVLDTVLKAAFPVKKAATFLWGDNYKPWSFSLATPKTAPWVFDYALQVNRAEYDEILLQQAILQGVQVLKAHEVTQAHCITHSSDVKVQWRKGNTTGKVHGHFLIDASGQNSQIAKQIGFREYDPYFQNMSFWSYYQGGKRFTGEMQGNVISEAFARGWVWLIPLKNDRYSVGIITDMQYKEQLRKQGKAEFFRTSLAMAPQISAILADAQQLGGIRGNSDWSYTSSKFTNQNIFLCGDSACFIDPLFSQGIHLACYAAVLAASTIDYILKHPDEKQRAQRWYDSNYRAAYDAYHQFVSAFYAAYEGQNDGFWNNRSSDKSTLKLSYSDSYNDEQIEKLRSAAALLIELGEHVTDNLDDGYDTELFALRRLNLGN